MDSILKRIIAKLRVTIFPSQHDIELKRWFADNNDEKKRYEYDLNQNSLVLDLGGYNGQWASDIYSRYNCKILIFEPVKLFADNIKKRFKHNNKIETFCFALGSFKRDEFIALNADGSSLFGDKSFEKQLIHFEDVVSFFNRYKIERIDLIKINIEGGEYELLPRMLEAGLLNKINNIQIQFHNNNSESERQMNLICKELSKTHKPIFQYKFIWENWTLINQRLI